ncbi:hypothetical protein PVNG_06375 [Plasmodium vivax North Korean]|uniref:Vir protein n=1 Tax=Plasmodium vivax North Korean TaxID=1035514 RepID=A0A0J9W6C6_PLAVI|nr:hypothetical protein PVNG_06375 [Plasmodium vivax North Korean]
MVSHKDWRKRKELYEYFVDYSPMKQIVDKYDERCNEFYVYVENKAPLYKHFERLCPNRNPNKCPEFYDDCKKYNPKKVLLTFNCHHNITNKRKEDARSAPQRAKALLGSATDSEYSDGRKKPFDDPVLSGNSHNVRMYGNVLLGVVATTMTSGVLYRFTPLGGMIRNGLGWNTNTMRNFNGGDIRLYDYASEPFNPYPGEEHYIGYHPG